MKAVSVRELRGALGPLLDRVVVGEQIVVLRRGKAVARLVPEREIPSAKPNPYPLRGSVIQMSDDFDEPMDGLWEAVRT